VERQLPVGPPGYRRGVIAGPVGVHNPWVFIPDVALLFCRIRTGGGRNRR
jgi:hypothetical protein